MVKKSCKKCKRAYVFLLFSTFLFVFVSLAFSAGPVITCKHCGNINACDNGDPGTQQGWEYCIHGEELNGTPWCRVWGEFGDCEM